MVNISMPFPEDLWNKAEAAARLRGISPDEFVRNCVSSTVNQNRATDSLFADRAVFDGDVPSDLSENHDHYLYEGDT